MTKPRLILTRKLPTDVEARASARYEAALNLADTPYNDADWASAEADALLVTVTDRLDAARIGSLPPRVRILANFGVGTSHIDLDAARARGASPSPTLPTC